MKKYVYLQKYLDINGTYDDEIEARRWTDVPSTLFWGSLQDFGCASDPTKNIVITYKILVRPDSPHFPCMVKKSRWAYFLFCHKVSISASSVTHLTGCDGGNSPFRSDGQPMGSPHALFVSPTGLWTIWSRHGGFMRVHPHAGWPSCGCECKTLK